MDCGFPFLGANCSDLKPHLSSVFVDDLNVACAEGGKVYESFGISEEGAVVVVRPDGYIGTISSLDNEPAISEYFAGFMKPIEA